MMTYSEMERELNEIPKFGAKASLSNLSAYLELANHPERNLRVIHIAGTNGKGSVSAYIDSILRQAGYTTALFTSPHLIKINERFRINFKECSDEELINVWCSVKDYMVKGEEKGLQSLTFFEILFFMGMLIFSEKAIDYCILETGLGGRLDATVLSNPVLSVITSISYDHTEILGDTIEKIAAEKAGIIKEGIPVVAIDEENGAFSVIERTAKEKNAPVYGLKSQELTILKKCENTIDFSINSRYYKISNLKVKSYASYQVQNAALAVLAVKVLLPEVSQDVIREGIVKMYWPGRMEEIAENVYVDGAHNPGAVHQIYNSLTDSDKEWLLLFAVCSDKDYSEMIRVLGRLPWKRIYITKIDSARGADTAAVKQCFKEETAGCPIYEYDNARTAFETALKDREYENLLCLGSLYLAGEIKDFATTIF
ncbi:bifunctional folylpolyglutamate synthase/dihydrofolate synthase [Anaerobutyricum soehngenii]|uniref:bifunctional folylpolyglutamate synthase/dihydrofolate synthase n=1 Tax=Anaerobutyricum soehngenii TaxID=105843 RepID=UPI001C10F423|nr:folylpolyglutamate synthase/dihydrofolate synthase family protein [Anaerobutyricum soehngenii]MBU5417011.1 bifunctional folylpolyglutamate synthase/dihydrofolate synthase [Anaerobutyricum soehngenii]